MTAFNAVTLDLLGNLFALKNNKYSVKFQAMYILKFRNQSI